MRKTVRKWFWAWDFDKEEKWLNDMAAKGLALVSTGFCRYTFEDCTPGEYNVRIELLDNLPGSAESQQYIKFIEDTGAEWIGSYMRWVYFRRKTDNGEFNLYSDTPSRIKHLNRVLFLLVTIGILEISIGLINITMSLGSGLKLNLISGLLCLAVGLLLAYGCLRLNLKKKKLIKQQSLFE